MTGRLLIPTVVLAALALSLLGSECDPQTTDEIALYRVSGAPPTRTALILEEDDQGTPARIQLSQGVVLAARCWDTCDFTCDQPVTTVGDTNVLQVLTVERPSSVTQDFALVAVGAGTTNLTITTDCASKTYFIEVSAD